VRVSKDEAALSFETRATAPSSGWGRGRGRRWQI